MNYINITPKADSDIDQCYEWICKKNPDAARRFLASVERACAIVAEMPGIGSPRYADISLIRGVRMIKVGKGLRTIWFFTLNVKRPLMSSVFCIARGISRRHCKSWNEEWLNRNSLMKSNAKQTSQDVSLKGCLSLLTIEALCADQDNDGTTHHHI